MRRKRQSTADLLDEPKLDISSLIDVCFLLLIFFIVTTTIVKREQDISMRLPDCCGGRLPVAEPLVIALEDNGKVWVNPDQFPEVVASVAGGRELPQLEDRLMMMKESGMDVVVQLRVAKNVDYQRFIDVLNCLAKMKVDRTGLVDL